MKYVALGSTDIQVSCVGLGTVKFGRNQGVRYPHEFNIPADHDIIELLNTAQDLGINLIDTAPAYGASEERLGKILQNKHEWVIATKVGEEFNEGKSYFDFSPQAIRQSIERSLMRLRVEVLDIVLVHSNGEDKKIIEENEVFQTLEKLKQAGFVRAYGMSTKTIEGGLLAVDNSDVVMVTYNPTEMTERPVIEYAQQKNKGVFIKKALASGHLPWTADDPVLAAMQFVFSEPGVNSVIVGTINKAHLQHNVACALQANRL